MNRAFTPHTRFIAKTTYCLNYKVCANDCHLIYVLSGEALFEAEGSTYPLTPHTLIYWPCGIAYRVKYINNLFFYTLNFDFSTEFENQPVMVPQPAENFDFSKILNTISDIDAPIFEKVLYFKNAHWAQELLEHIYTESLKKHDEYILIKNSYLKILITQIYRRNTFTESENPLCLEIKNMVKNNLTLNIKEIAESVHYHPFYLNQVFRKNERCSLHEYITKQRLIKAKEMVTTTTKSLEEIALLCGFSSHSHLTTAFKKEFNITPSFLRKQF